METVREVEDFDVCYDNTFCENHHACGEQMVVFGPIVIDKIRLNSEEAKVMEISTCK